MIKMVLDAVLEVTFVIVVSTLVGFWFSVGWHWAL